MRTAEKIDGACLGSLVNGAHPGYLRIRHAGYKGVDAPVAELLINLRVFCAACHDGKAPARKHVLCVVVELDSMPDDAFHRLRKLCRR